MSLPEASLVSNAEDFLSDYKRKTVQPRLDEGYDIVNMFGERYDRAYQMINPYYAEAYRDQSFYLGNQWDLNQVKYLADQQRLALTYNMCMRMINLIEGIQRQNRLATIISPVQDDQNAIADIATDCIQYANNRGNFYETLSTGFKDAMVTGVSWISPYMDYRNDPVNGEVAFNLDHWNDTIWDPFFYKKDLSDCNFFARRKYISRTDVISLLPEQEDVIKRLSYGTRDNKFTYMPYVRQGAFNKLMSYTEYWTKSWVTKDVLVDMATGETSEWKGTRERLSYIQAMMPNMQLIKKPVQQVNLGIIVENQLLYYGVDPYGINDYAQTPIFAIYEPSYDLFQWKMQSLIRLIRDPQLELNKRRSKMVDILDSQAYPGWKAKSGSVENSASLFKSGQGPVIFMKPTAQMTDVEKLAPADIPPGHFALMDAFEKDIPNILGINPEMLGMPENPNLETAAILAKMRVNAGLVSLRRLFDGLAETQQLIGQKVLKMIQANWSSEKIQKITKKQCPPEFFSQNFYNYDIVVEEGILTDTQRQSQFMQLLALKQLGVNIPDSLLVKNSNLHGKVELNEILDAQAEQQQQFQQKQEALEMEQLRVATDGIEAKAQSDQALAAERLNKIHLDQALNAERISRAEEEKTAELLNIVKAVKELQGIDHSQLMEKLNMLNSLAKTELDQHRMNHDIDRGQHEMQMAEQQPMTSETGV
jgi:hypothetical protein